MNATLATSSNSLPTVDAIVPCYQYGHYLASCVTSLLGQEGAKVRVLIVDDCSTDNTEQLGRQLQSQYPAVEYRRHEKNRGSIATFNEGLAWASADYMLLISADDYVLPGAFRRATALMAQHADVGMTFGLAIDVVGAKEEVVTDTLANQTVRQAAGAQEARVLDEAGFLGLFVDMRAQNLVRTPTAIVRTAAQKAVGYYREDHAHTADLDMWLRFAAHGRIGIINDYQGVYRYHGANISSVFLANGALADLAERQVVFLDYLRKRRWKNRALAAPGWRIREFMRDDALATDYVELLRLGRHEEADQRALLAADAWPRLRLTSHWLRWYRSYFKRRVLGMRPQVQKG